MKNLVKEKEIKRKLVTVIYLRTIVFPVRSNRRYHPPHRQPTLPDLGYHRETESPVVSCLYQQV